MVGFVAAVDNGMGDKAWFEPPANNPRIGVDRPEGYTAPTGDHCF
jgi:hypothetical protein